MSFCISKTEYLRNPDFYTVISGPSPTCGCFTAIPTPVGSDVVVQSQAGDSFVPITMTFSEVTVAGDTYATLVLQEGYEIYLQLTTSATFSGPIIIAIRMPDTISEDEFNRLFVVRSTPDITENVTADLKTIFDDGTENPFVRDYATRTIYAITTGFSYFGVLLAAGPVSGTAAPKKDPSRIVPLSCALEGWWWQSSACGRSGGECCKGVCYETSCGSITNPYAKSLKDATIQGRRNPVDCSCVYTPAT